MSIITQYINALSDKRNARAFHKIFEKTNSLKTLAAAGTTQATGTRLTGAVNSVTGANGTAGVVLPVPKAGDPGVWVINTDASNDLLVYPAVDGQINALGTDAAYTLPAAQSGYFAPVSEILWYTGIVGATSAQIAYLTGAVAGTAAASKVLVLDADKKIGDLAQINVLGLGAVATNQALGATALDANTTGARNTAVGVGSLSANTTGVDNTGVGKDSLLVATTATGNTAIGSLAGDAITSGSNNTLTGFNAGGALTTGANNTAVGASALLTETTSVSNTAVGAGALQLLLAGAGGNVAVGKDAGNALTTGSLNVAVGLDALGADTTGASNVAVGKDAMLVATGSLRCVAVGATALDAMTTTGADSTAVGYDALGGNTTGVQNTAVGSGAGNNLTVGTNNTCVGYNATASANNATNEFTLGAGVTVIRSGVTTITAISDGRDKIDIAPLSLGLDLLRKLRPVQFRWNRRDGKNPHKELVPGFVAQDLLEAEKDLDAEWLNLVYDANPDRLESSTGQLVPPMVKAIQELAAKVERLEARV